MRTSSPAKQKALHFLRVLIEHRDAAGETRLPPIRQLARDAVVSYVSMWKAVNELVGAGLLTTNHRTGIHIAHVPAEHAADSGAPLPTGAGQQRLKWQRLSTRLERDILDGVYAPGSLMPSAKELTRVHGVCHETLRKAVLHLVEQGWLQAHRRGYLVARSVRASRHGAIVLMVSGDRSGQPRLTTNRSQDNFRAMEAECGRSGVALHVVTVDYDGSVVYVPPEVGDLLRAGSSRSPVLGFIVWSIGFAHEGAVTRTLDTCLRAGKPVAMLDESGGLEIPVAQRRRIQLFSAASSPHCARQVGRYLLRMGHRRIAFISPVHGMPWSVARLVGLDEVYSEAGLPGAVLPCTAGGGFYPRRTTLDSQIERLLARIPDPESEESQLLQRAIRSSYATLDMAMRSEIVHERLLPLLERARTTPEVTAWVAVSDGFALDCLDFLAGRGVRVPDQVSVIGFDDTHEAFQHGLTSYNFNGAALMHAMVTHVLSRRLPGRQDDGTTPVEIDGFISVRKTVRQEAGRVTSDE